MHKFTKLALAGMVLLLTGCGHVADYLDIASDKGVSRRYIEVLNQWTKKETLYSQFETKAVIIATFKGAEFNQSYLNEYVRIYNLTESEKKRREDLQAGFSAESTEFFVYAALPNKEANDFHKPNSTWSISLIDGQGKSIAPLEIRKIEKVSTIMETFFPYINKYYGSCYSLKFMPLPAGEKEGAKRPKNLKLVFASVLGRVELTWP